MAETVIRAGAVLEVPNRAEMREDISAALRDVALLESAREREQARGLKRIETYIPVNPAAATFFTGPLIDEGYVWSLRLAGISTAQGGLPNIFRASGTGDTRRPIWVDQSSGTVHVATWSSDQARLRHGDGLYLTSTGNLLGIYLSAWQVPAEREYEFA